MTESRAMRARYRRILRFAARAMVQAWWFEVFLPRWGMSALAARGRTRRLTRLAERFHVLAVDLGGLMIKVGQFLSSRLDVLPPEITRELEGLQDEVPPVPFADIRALAESELGMPLDRAFAYVDPHPLAAASLGQAHRATLSALDESDTGIRDAVVKIQRPGIDAVVDVDLSALRRVARWLSRVALVSRRVDMPALVEEFAATCREEIDYLHEAGNAERFATDFSADDRVAVPDVVWERSTRRVLTLADVTAIKINDVDALRAAGIDPVEVAAEFAAVMFDQLFVNGFFHADPHPGNIFVTPLPGGPSGDGEDDRAAGASRRRWRFTFIDFGMMGEVPASLRDGLRRLLIAAAARDSEGLVAGIQNVGVLLPSADTVDLERAMSALFARFGGMGFAELQDVDPRELRDFAVEFGDVIRSLPFQLPENFLLIIRAMSLTSGMCSALDPTFNIWNAVEPYAARLLRDERSGFVRDAAQQVVAFANLAVRLPRRMDAALTRLEDGRVSIDVPRVERRVASIERLVRGAVSAILFMALIVAGVLLRSSELVFGTILMVASLAPLVHALVAVFRRRP